MAALNELKSVADELLSFAEKNSEVKEAEAYVSARFLGVYRIAYHSKIPSNGVEEAKIMDSQGISLRILFKDNKYGFGSCDNDFTKIGFKEAYSKAFESRVYDSDFHSLSDYAGKSPFKPEIDKKIINLDTNACAKKAWEMLDGALDELENGKETKSNITGEFDVFGTRFCVKSTKGIFAFEEKTGVEGSLTANIEGNETASGTSFKFNSIISKLKPSQIGKEAVEKAELSKKSEKIETGKYRVLLSEGVVAELFNSRLDVAISSVDLMASPFNGLVGKKVASELLTITDDPFFPESPNSTGSNDEGNPSGKVTIIDNGVFKNFLSNDYYKKKKDEYAKFRAFNGYRGGRSHSSDVGVSATNLVVSKGNLSDKELISEVKNGIFIGRIWYTYPVNGYSSFDYSSTIRGDSFIIKNGEIVSALVPNSVRILDSFSDFMKNIIGVGKQRKFASSWGQDEIVVTPKICLSKMNLKRI
jgi:PmbA protein